MKSKFMYQIVKLKNGYIAGIFVVKRFLFFFKINKYEVIGEAKTYQSAIEICRQHQYKQWNLFIKSIEINYPEFISPSSLINTIPSTSREIELLTTKLFSKN